MKITISINIFICFKYYTVWIHFQIWFKCETPLPFSNKNHEAVVRSYSVEKAFFEISQIWQENTCARASLDYVKMIELHVVIQLLQGNQTSSQVDKTDYQELLGAW